jgi:hypothetical protein
MKTCPKCKIEYPESNFYTSFASCIPCKKEYDKNYRKSHKEKLLNYRRSRRDSPDGYVDRFVERAHQFTSDTDISRAFFQGKMDRCAFTGKQFTYSNNYDSYHDPTAPSIDRIDSKEGYYTWNTQVILSCINRMKNDLPQEDFQKLWVALVGE